jgi:hypothetical protein
LIFNSNLENYKNIDFNSIFHYIMDKGKKLKKFISDNKIDENLIETLKNSIHFQVKI